MATLKTRYSLPSIYELAEYVNGRTYDNARAALLALRGNAAEVLGGRYYRTDEYEELTQSVVFCVGDYENDVVDRANNKTLQSDYAAQIADGSVWYPTGMAYTTLYAFNLAGAEEEDSNASELLDALISTLDELRGCSVLDESVCSELEYEDFCERVESDVTSAEYHNPTVKRLSNWHNRYDRAAVVNKVLSMDSVRNHNHGYDISSRDLESAIEIAARLVCVFGRVNATAQREIHRSWAARQPQPRLFDVKRVHILNR